jgi:DivIVA domain-containing protein
MTQLDDLLTHPDGSPDVRTDSGSVARLTVEGGGEWITPADVHNKVFSTVRLREGYDLGQVDTFLYEVETTLGGVLRENAALRARLNASRYDSTAAESASRIVGLAQETADRAVATAHEQARDILAAARDHAEAVRREAHDYGNRLRQSLEVQIGQLRALLVEIDEQEETY